MHFSSASHLHIVEHGLKWKLICDVFNEQKVHIRLHHFAVTHIGEGGGCAREATVVHLKGV
jgi:hypothetical protein